MFLDNPLVTIFRTLLFLHTTCNFFPHPKTMHAKKLLLLADLKWDTLQVRREKARLLMFYKATHGLVDIPLPDTLIPLSVRNTRQYHPKKFYSMVSNTKSYKGTFFPSTVAMWNSLPPNILDKPNISQFRQALDHFY